MNKKKELILKTIMSVLMVILLLNVAFYFIDVYALNGPSYYTKHFLLAVSLFFLGIIALMMPMGIKNKNRFSGDGKGDNLIIVVGFLLIACALISIIYSFFQ